MAGHVAASAYGHCLALVHDEAVAAHLAVVALRRGGRGLGAVLAHARHEALEEVARTPPPPVALAPEAGPTEVAWALAATRPALEVAMVDLAGRYGLRRAGLGTALGLPPATAAARVAAVGEAWDTTLDPALLAWLGGGECEGLAALLEGRPRAGAADLTALAPAVADHTAACASCGDRQRAMASVRRLVAGTPLPAPPEQVAAAAARSRHQPPAPAPAPAVGARRRGPALRALGAAAAGLALAGVAAVVAGVDGDDTPPRPASLQALTRLPAAAGALEVLPSELEVSAATVSLLNTSDGTVSWEADADAPWLDVEPSRGRLDAGREQVLRLSGSPPEGEIRTTVRVAGGDGSAAAAMLTGTVEHPPDLGATAQGCRVTAVVEDETDVALTLHARDAGGAETRVAMALDDTAAVADLPPGRGPLTWWVSAVDGRGNQARTADVALPQGC